MRQDTLNNAALHFEGWCRHWDGYGFSLSSADVGSELVQLWRHDKAPRATGAAMSLLPPVIITALLLRLHLCLDLAMHWYHYRPAFVV